MQTTLQAVAAGGDGEDDGEGEGEGWPMFLFEFLRHPFSPVPQ